MARARVISVFGSAVVGPESPEYALGRRVGRLMAEAGWVVVTGGYEGVMAAVCRGAREAGGHTVGATLPALWGFPPNPWVCEERPSKTFVERLSQVTTETDAYVALDGGVGTLTEFALAWSLLETRSVPPRPLVAVGPRWRRLMIALTADLVMRPTDLPWVTVVDDAEQLMETLRRAFAL